MNTTQIIILIVAIIVVLIVLLLAVSYKRIPPNQMCIISGFGKTKTIKGKATFVLPFFQRADTLSLSVMQIDVRTTEYVPNKEFIDIKVDAVANIKISADTEIELIKAAENFLGKTESEITAIAKDVLEGNMREIIGQMELMELVHNRDLFADKVKESAVEDMRSLGLDIINITIQSFSDRNNVINDLGAENVNKITKDASIAKANSDKAVEIAKSNAVREANDTRVKNELEIAKKNHDLQIEIAKLKTISEVERAKAEASFNKERVIQDQSILIAEENSKIEVAKFTKLLETENAFVELERLKATLLVRAEADKTKKETEALAIKLEQTIKAEAEADVLKINSNARREAAQAEAEAIIKLGEANAQKILLEGEAEAKAILAKAEAQKSMQESAKLEMILNSNVLPELAESLVSGFRDSKMTFYGNSSVDNFLETQTKNISSMLDVFKDTGLNDILNSFVNGKAIGKGIASSKVVEEETEEDL